MMFEFVLVKVIVFPDESGFRDTEIVHLGSE